MKPLWHEERWDVEINWSRPKEYERVLDEGSPNDEYARLYLISARYGANPAKAIYIGKTYDQCVSKRLSQLDHQKRYAEFLEHYPKHRFYVSHGIVTICDGKLTRSRIDDIEWILIYANEPKHAHNIKSFWKHSVTTPYGIKNNGSRCTLPQVITFGIFIR